MLMSHTESPEKVQVGTKVRLWGFFHVDEIVELGFTGGPPTGGDAVLAFRGKQTDPIPFDASADVVQAALEALTSIGHGGVLVTGGPWPATAMKVWFVGKAVAKQNIPLITATDTFAPGGDVTVAQLQAGGRANATTVTCALQKPDGILVTPAPTVTQEGVGAYYTDYLVADEGVHGGDFIAVGAGVDVTTPIRFTGVPKASS